MRYLLIGFGLLLLTSGAHAEESVWSGEWVTDRGQLLLTESGGKITGRYGQQGTLNGEAKGAKLEFTCREGRSAGEGTLVLGKDGNSFTCEWKGDGGKWRGWRGDPDAKGKPADFSGVWVSSLGTMVLTQKGDKVEGSYGSQGWSTLEGTVKGRRLSLTWKRIQWSGKAWIEQTKDGDRFFGLTEESPPVKWLGVRVDEFEPDVKPKAGAIVKGLSENSMLYYLRAPAGWRKGKKTDAIVLLHGSNWTTAGMTYVTPKNWPDLGKDYMIVGIQGEQWADWSDADDLRHNYTYVNWMGKSTYKGYPYTDRESPFLVSQVVAELKEKQNLDRIFLVGHSQGGFLAYLMLMNYPEMFAGVAPLSCGLVMQAEPDVFEDEELKKAQRATPIAMVHGTQDEQWGPTAGDYNHERFAASGFPMLEYVTPDRPHAYDFLPVGEVIAWLDAMSTTDSKVLLAFADASANKGAWRDVAGALVRADLIRARGKLTAVEKRLDAAAEKDAERLLALVKKNEDGSWMDDFVLWREQFEFAPAGRNLMKAYEKLRAVDDPAAEKLIGEARAAFQSGDAATGWAKYEEVVEKHYACDRYKLVKRWLANRK